MVSHTVVLVTLIVAGAAGAGINSVAIDAEGEASGVDVTSLLQTQDDVLMLKGQIKASTEDGSSTAEHFKQEADPPVAPAPVEPATPAPAAPAIDTKAFLAEFVAMTLFVIIGCGTAMAVPDQGGKLLQVSLAFGFAITSLAYTIGHYSGGQINCAVTFGLCITSNLSWSQGAMNFLGQMLGSVLGAVILNVIFGEARDETKGLGTNGVAEKDGTKNILGALVGEFAMTFLLVFVVLETAKNPAAAANAVNAPIAIGLAVFLAHCVLIPIDGCSINPTRTFGPAIIRKITYKDPGSLGDMWIFWVGPLLGAAAAAGVNTCLMK